MEKHVALFGGSSPFSACVIEHLIKNGFYVIFFTTKPKEMSYVGTSAKPGEIVVLDYSDLEKVYFYVSKCSICINIHEAGSASSKKELESVNINFAKKVAAISKKCRVSKFIQLSAMSDDKRRSSEFIKSKIICENALTSEFPEAIIIRSEVIFWRDMSVNDIQNVLFQIKDTAIEDATLFRPIYAGDLAQLIVKVASGKTKSPLVYNAFGGRAYSLECLNKKLGEVIAKHSSLIRFNKIINLYRLATFVVRCVRQSIEADNLHEIGLRSRLHSRFCINNTKNDVEKAGIRTTRMETII